MSKYAKKTVISMQKIDSIREVLGEMQDHDCTLGAIEAYMSTLAMDGEEAGLIWSSYLGADAQVEWMAEFLA